MEAKKYKLKYKKTECIMLYVMLALFCITAVINTLKLNNLFSLVSYDRFIDTAGVIFSVLMGAFISTTLFCSKYTIADNSLTEYISIFKTRILCSDIAKIIYQEQTESLFVLYTKKQTKPAVLKVNVKKELFDEFTASLREINSQIVYEIMSKNAK